MWESVAGLVAEVKKTDEAGALTAALAMSFVLIDTLTFLGLPDGRDRQSRVDFIAWVNTYVKGHEDQPYQYEGLDVYGARCAILHVYGSDASFHAEHPDAKRFGYHDGGQHVFDPEKDKTLVLIGAKSFVNDVILAAQTFLERCGRDQQLRTSVEARLPGVLKTFEIGKLAK